MQHLSSKLLTISSQNLQGHGIYDPFLLSKWIFKNDNDDFNLQGGYRSDKEVGQLGCGHCHHITCIRQWLRQKNECPICKIPPMAHKSRFSSD